MVHVSESGNGNFLSPYIVNRILSALYSVKMRDVIVIQLVLLAPSTGEGGRQQGASIENLGLSAG